MAKRTYHSGAVYQRSDRRWEAQLRTPDGRRKSAYAYTRRDVLARLREAQWAVAQGLPSVPATRPSASSWTSGSPRPWTPTATYPSNARGRSQEARGVSDCRPP